MTKSSILDYYTGVFKEKEQLSLHSTIRIGGPADYFCQPQSEQEVMQLLRFVRAEEQPVIFVGRGSNILFSDEGFRGVVIHPGPRLGKCNLVEPNLIAVGCGADNAVVVRFCADHEMTGLEYLTGVPSTIGGAIAMNAGAYGEEISKFVEKVRLVDADNIVEKTREEMGFSYRHTEGVRGCFVVKVWLRLESISRDDAYAATREILSQRRETQPLHLPSLGSVFKRVDDHYPGQLIEEAGCKGLQVGDMQVSPLHANFIVNLGSGKAADMLSLVEQVQERVKEHSGVELPLEIKLVGFDQ